MIRFLSKARKKDLMGTAILRLDFNTEDDWRMKMALPTVKFLLSCGSKVIIVSHKGRPNGFDKKLSLKGDSKKLGRFLGREVIFLKNFDFRKIRKAVAEAPGASVFVLENIRFLPGEARDDKNLTKKLASLGDFYVNDAFPVSHRKAASICGITRFLPAFAGLGLEREIRNLSAVMKNPKRPLLLVIGGGKASDKVGVIKNFKNKADWFLIGGASANTLLWLKGIDIGSSVADRRGKRPFKPILSYRGLVLPVDFKIEEKKILDIGPKSAQVFKNKVRLGKTIIWNGPLGLVEKKRFSKGTLDVAKAIIRNKKSFSLTGGGETVMFLKKHKLDKKFDFVSTGGGAMLDFLAGKKLPGIVALEKSGR